MSNSFDIAAVGKCHKDKGCLDKYSKIKCNLDKCHCYSLHLLKLVPENLLWSLVKIYMLLICYPVQQAMLTCSAGYAVLFSRLCFQHKYSSSLGPSWELGLGWAYWQVGAELTEKLTRKELGKFLSYSKLWTKSLRF